MAVALCVAVAVAVGGIYHVKAERQLSDTASVNSALAYGTQVPHGINVLSTAHSALTQAVYDDILGEVMPLSRTLAAETCFCQRIRRMPG